MTTFKNKNFLASYHIALYSEVESHRRSHFPWVNRVTEVGEDTTAYHVEVIWSSADDIGVDLFIDD